MLWEDSYISLHTNHIQTWILMECLLIWVQFGNAIVRWSSNNIVVPAFLKLFWPETRIISKFQQFQPYSQASTLEAAGTTSSAVSGSFLDCWIHLCDCLCDICTCIFTAREYCLELKFKCKFWSTIFMSSCLNSPFNPRQRVPFQWYQSHREEAMKKRSDLAQNHACHLTWCWLTEGQIRMTSKTHGHNEAKT